MKSYYLDQSFTDKISDQALVEFKRVCENRKLKATDQPQFKQFTFLNKAEIFYATNSIDDEIVQLILKSNMRRKLIVATTNFELAELLSHRVEVHFIYGNVFAYPTIWYDNITLFKNAEVPFTNGLQLIESYSFGMFQYFETITNEIDERKFTQIHIKSVDLKQILNAIRKELQSAERNAKLITKKSSKDEQKQIAGNHKMTKKVTRSVNKNKTIYESALKSKLIPKKNQIRDNKNVEELYNYMIDNRTASKEQFLSLVATYYSMDILAHDKLHLYRYEKNKVQKTLEEQGVIEVLDLTTGDKLIVVTYKAVHLISQIQESVGVDGYKFIITIPEYMKELMEVEI